VLNPGAGAGRAGGAVDPASILNAGCSSGDEKLPTSRVLNAERTRIITTQWA